ncbi:MAG: neutral zinc metallopeptidase [Gordonia sp. (in: high G+C Gram-positive bacteria)]
MRLRSRRFFAALAVPVAALTMLTACSSANNGTPVRAPKAEPIRCTEAKCPELPALTDREVNASGVTDQNRATAVPAYLTNVLDDLDATWKDWFSQLNIDESTVGRQLIEPGTTFTSECLTDSDSDVKSLPSDFPNALYCSIDTQPDGDGHDRKGTVVLPVETFADIWDGRLMGQRGVMLGDFTAATIVAHEYGHHVMYRLASAYGMTDSQMPQGNNAESLADCFAGNWAGTVFRRKDLSLKDIAQAVMLMVSVSDTGPNQGHGTVVERVGAISRGFAGPDFHSQGQPVMCLQKYWPQALGA